MKIKRNIVILFTHLLVKKKLKKTKELNLCFPYSGYSIHFLMTISSNTKH